MSTCVRTSLKSNLSQYETLSVSKWHHNVFYFTHFCLLNAEVKLEPFLMKILQLLENSLLSCLGEICLISYAKWMLEPYFCDMYSLNKGTLSGDNIPYKWNQLFTKQAETAPWLEISNEMLNKVLENVTCPKLTWDQITSIYIVLT